MLEDVDERDVVEALDKARKLAERADQAACNAPPEMAAALRRSSRSMVTNLEKALEVLRKSRPMVS